MVVVLVIVGAVTVIVAHLVLVVVACGGLVGCCGVKGVFVGVGEGSGGCGWLLYWLLLAR